MNTWVGKFCYQFFGDGTATLVSYNKKRQDACIIVPFEVKHEEKVYKVVRIGKNAFEDVKCDMIRLPNTIKEICEKAFFNSSVKCLNRDVSEHRLNVYGFAFASCKSLEEVNFNGPVELDDEDTFAGCTKLEHIDSQNFIRWLPIGSFKDCKSLKAFYFTENINIEDYAFENVTLDFVRIGAVSFGWDFIDAIKHANILCHANSPFVNFAYEGLNVQILDV